MKRHVKESQSSIWFIGMLVSYRNFSIVSCGLKFFSIISCGLQIKDGLRLTFYGLQDGLLAYQKV